ncbi:MAG: hypothetical protein JSR45_17725 [Proteobacteria bacterium]|nr:hypothetical protein [Pseudomonadota bacterium]
MPTTTIPATYLLRLFRRAGDTHEARCESHHCDTGAEAIGRGLDLLRRARDSVAVEVWRAETLVCRLGEPHAVGSSPLDDAFGRRCARAWSK